MDETKRIEQLVRSVIERQVATTPAGRTLTAHHEALVKNLVTNIVGNLTMAVVNEIEDARESQTVAA